MPPPVQGSLRTAHRGAAGPDRRVQASKHMPVNRQAVVMARHGVPISRSVLADWMGRTGALIAPVVEHMAMRLMADSTRLYVGETTAPVLDPGQGKDEDRLSPGRAAR